MDQCMSEHCLYKPYLLWTVLNGIPVMIGSILVCFVEVGQFFLFFSYIRSFPVNVITQKR